MIDFDNLSAHCDFLVRGLLGERERFEAYVRDRTEGLNQDERDIFFDIHSYDYWRISDIFPELQAASAFLMTYAVFEKNLNDICCYSNCQKDLDLSLKDFRGQGIERAKLYLSKVCGLSSVFEGVEWQEVLEISNLRNAISHASGDLELDKSQHKKAFNYANNNNKIKVVRCSHNVGTAHVELTLDFVKKLCRKSQNIFGETMFRNLQNFT
ncbi:hypothetical protein SAMN04487958_104125 [Vreelandella subterranea]|uniref:RiboL-PSP-HEPN domain-containing protein n=2 Tax=Vreelandella subterranea TaxID=416874 RepID=A0A1H9T1F3_9GAMM|nr:hypothetical protein SAMN04487958_104125 [Halomonas subterranea]